MDVLLSQARQWEETGEYERAVDCYLKGKKNTCLKIIDTIITGFFFQSIVPIPIILQQWPQLGPKLQNWQSNS